MHQSFNTDQKEGDEPPMCMPRSFCSFCGPWFDPWVCEHPKQSSWIGDRSSAQYVRTLGQMNKSNINITIYTNQSTDLRAYIHKGDKQGYLGHMLHPLPRKPGFAPPHEKGATCLLVDVMPLGGSQLLKAGSIPDRVENQVTWLTHSNTDIQTQFEKRP